jgi:hypothetical protein
MTPFEFYWHCVEIEAGESGRRLTDDDLIFSYVGMGATATVSAGDIRKMISELQELRTKFYGEKELEVFDE